MTLGDSYRDNKDSLSAVLGTRPPAQPREIDFFRLFNRGQSLRRTNFAASHIEAPTYHRFVLAIGVTQLIAHRTCHSKSKRKVVAHLFVARFILPVIPRLCCIFHRSPTNAFLKYIDSDYSRLLSVNQAYGMDSRRSHLPNVGVIDRTPPFQNLI